MASSEQHLQGQRRTTLLDLPLELIQRILTFLPAARRARAASLCRYIAAVVAVCEAAGSVWCEATLVPLILSDIAFDSLLTWAACRSKDLQRLRLSRITVRKVGDSEKQTCAIVGALHAVHTLRIDGACGADMCATMLLHCPQQNQLRHLALHDLTLHPDDPHLVAAVQAQSQLVECVLSFNRFRAAASDGATTTVLTAAGACSKLQRLCVGTEGTLGLRCIPGSLAALGSLTCLELRHGTLQGPQQLPPNLVDLRLDDHSKYALPASLGAMTSLTRLAAICATAPPLSWPPQLQFLELDGWQWGAATHVGLGHRLASLAAVTTLRFLKLSACIIGGTYAEELDMGTAPLLALEGLSITSSLDTLPSLDCLSRLTALGLSGSWFEGVPQSLCAATACVALDLTDALDTSGRVDASSFSVITNLTALRRLSLKGLDHKQELHQALQAVKQSMLEKCGKAAVVALSKTDHFAAVIPDPACFLETEQGWRL